MAAIGLQCKLNGKVIAAVDHWTYRTHQASVFSK